MKLPRPQERALTCRCVNADAIDNWLAGIMDRHGALSPISVAAQFLIERRNIISRLVENVPGAQLDAIDSATADKFAEDMEGCSNTSTSLLMHGIGGGWSCMATINVC